MDEDIRSAKRLPLDTGDRARLAREWLRKGFGWHGEILPSFCAEHGIAVRCGCSDFENRNGDMMPCRDEPNGYRWAMEWSESANGHPIKNVLTRQPKSLDIEFVYVQGGDDRCELCPGWTRSENDGRQCPDCRDTGVIRIAPMYVSRYPVLWKEYIAFCHAMPRGYMHQIPPEWGHAREWSKTSMAAYHFEQDYSPVTRTTEDDAAAFCTWSGLRLLSKREWLWAARGPARVCTHGYISADPATSNPYQVMAVEDKLKGMFRGCHACIHGAEKYVDYPWGGEPPSKERCVWVGHPAYGIPRVEGSVQMGKPGPVSDCVACLAGTCTFGPACGIVGTGPFKEKLVPARAAGASWCGVQDMCGNVEELVSDTVPRHYAALVGFGFVMGGSYKTPFEGEGSRIWHDRSEALEAELDQIGFRVALSAAEPCL